MLRHERQYSNFLTVEILPINEPEKAASLLGSISKSVRLIFTSEFGYALPYLTRLNSLFFWLKELC